jgi:hypothetical protein
MKNLQTFDEFLNESLSNPKTVKELADGYEQEIGKLQKKYAWFSPMSAFAQYELKWNSPLGPWNREIAEELLSALIQKGLLFQTKGYAASGVQKGQQIKNIKDLDLDKIYKF